MSTKNETKNMENGKLNIVQGVPHFLCKYFRLKRLLLKIIHCCKLNNVQKITLH